MRSQSSLIEAIFRTGEEGISQRDAQKSQSSLIEAIFRTVLCLNKLLLGLHVSILSNRGNLSDQGALYKRREIKFVSILSNRGNLSDSGYLKH